MILDIMLYFVQVVEKLIRGLAMEDSRNMFALFEHNIVDKAVESRVLVADVLAKFERYVIYDHWLLLYPTPVEVHRKAFSSHDNTSTTGRKGQSKDVWQSFGFLTRLAGSEEAESEGQWKLYFKLYCFLDVESMPKEGVEFAFMFEQVCFFPHHFMFYWAF